MRRRALLLALAAALVGGCAGTPGGDRPTVVVTTNILGDVVANVVPPGVEVLVLMQPNADPHSFGISAQQAAELERADLVVHNGLGLEEGLTRHVEAARTEGVPTLAVGEHVQPLRYGDGGQAGRPDPHFWTDPARMVTATERIAEAVTAHVDGVDPAAVRARAAEYTGRLRELDAWMAGEFARIPPNRRALVTNHHVFGYLARRYDLRVIGAVIPSGTTLASPSASDLANLAGAIRAAGVGAIFADSSRPDRLTQVLARETGLRVSVVPLYSESLDVPGSEAATYLDMMRTNTTRIAEGLRTQL